MTDPYKILGITSGASDDEVKKAYRDMCRKYHPDRNPGNQAAEDMFKIVGEAYDTILEERKNASGMGGFNGSSAAYGYSGGSTSNSTSDASYYQAAANYINNRQYSQAIYALSRVQNRSAQWYYLSAVANAGTGNNYVAAEHARTASGMDPGNAEYRRAAAAFSRTGNSYGSMNGSYGPNVYYDGNFCAKLCALDMCMNLCCDMDVCLCC